MAKRKQVRQFGERVREAREAKRLKVVDLERMVGGAVTDQAIANIEAGTIPRLDRAQILAHALGFSLAEFDLEKIPEK